jgi:hypothetical protein
MPQGRRSHKVTVIGPSRDEVERIFGTNVAPIDPPVSNVASYRIAMSDVCTGLIAMSYLNLKEATSLTTWQTEKESR